MSEKLWYKTARTVVKAGGMPFPVTETLIELLKNMITEEQADFIAKIFVRKPNLSTEELKKKSILEDEALNKMLYDLQHLGVVVGSQSKTTGVTVYRLQPPFPGMFEFFLMRPGESEKEKRLARIFDKLFEEMSNSTSKNYDQIVPLTKQLPPITRVVPVEEEVEPGEDIILSKEDVKKLKKRIFSTYCYSWWRDKNISESRSI